ncbi:MAG: hypothetical protein A2015_16265 [Spirochaetes bacterium GWF1_31_7]|nr:MAG: hypothetical protein A2Y30_13635 [Spirochaetes bacterium GWE1_32_154]OHD50004.1 MAG: hypothetical protein A2Y29_11680 [Spirochaetes bacterium GWE2_31_10]OHD52320.1 MAG: hypothetical protein A2015_16265 [Spirochaetes bacterium GWF1_31_7]OHD80351.1 MAG: hypothetical protein A2355_00185 [Spirochaetes bacterium RIFOXYB1_FULL_32_8]HBD95265.1 class I SAM-dependent methyltransferase [Spirochaetia bacterium]
MECILCQSINNFEIHFGNKNKTYYKCNNCDLLFLDSSHLPAFFEEKSRYLTHENNIENKGYVSFLMTAIEPALSFFKKGMKILDFGCGPGPTLNLILKNNGFDCDIYDPIFYPEIDRTKKYDAIFATECFEHFFNPLKELKMIDTFLQSNGFLIIMTELWSETKPLSEWWYSKDITHVTFYKKSTFEYIADTFHYTIVYENNKNILILKKDG